MSSNPGDGAEEVVIQTEVSATFDEVIELAEDHGITINGKNVEASAPPQERKVVININLEKESEYEVHIPAGAVINTRGIPLDENVTFSFSTEVPVELESSLVAENPSREAQNVFAFLRENYGSQIISGTVANVSWNTNEAEWVHQHTGKYPALNGFDLIHLYASPANWIDYSDVSVVEDWWNNNGLVTLMWHWNVPTEKESDEYAFYTDETSFDISKAVQEGTWENEVIMDDLEKAAKVLKKLRDKNIPVLWRPLHEAAGGWFWWGDGSAQNCIDLWRIMFDYFESQNLNNLIWVWTVEPGQDSWYPGDEYVDIVTRDIYNKPENSQMVDEFNNLRERFPEKPVAMGECGSIAKISQQWDGGAKWSWFMTWYDYERTNNTE
ncbi:MAG: glycosyl hydrolase, partial [Marinilabiliaceae bacterium]